MTALLDSRFATLLLLGQRSFLAALGALVAFQILNGRISTRGLLRDRETGGVSALRLQLLMATAITAASYATAIAHQTADHFPPVDASLIALIGASNGLVIIKQAVSKLRRFSTSTPKS